MSLRVEPCRSLCDWSGPARAGVLACRGCGSQWVPSEPWTPRQADGSLAPAVRAARVSAARGGAAGSAGS